MKENEIECDYHLHSNYSLPCGKQTVKELLETAKKSGIKKLALTDHDTIDGLSVMALESYKAGIEFVPGMELTFHIKGTAIASDIYYDFHMLALDIDYQKSGLKEILDKRNELIKERINKIIAYLQANGYPLVQVKNPYFWELTRSLKENGYFKTQQEAYDFLFGKEIKMRFPAASFDSKEAIDFIHSLGGKAVIAHVFRKLDQDPNRFSLVTKILNHLMSQGLDGIEVYHKQNFLAAGVLFLEEYASKNNLIQTIGSDRHDFIVNDSYFPFNKLLPFTNFSNQEVLSLFKKIH